MTLGQKVKAARLERKMTQKELVGDYITRNMLSKIENDSATPSVKTLEYLAAALELPVGYFMSGSRGDELTPEAVDSARHAFREGRHDMCLKLLEDIRLEGCGWADEVQLLRSLSAFALAKERYAEGRIEEARSLAEDSIYYNGLSMYASAAHRTEVLLFTARCQLALGTGFDEALAQYREAYRAQGLGEFYRLMMAEYYLQSGQSELAVEQMDFVEDSEKPEFLLLRGRLAYRECNYERAIAQLEQAEQLAAGLGNSQLISALYAMLEECWKELGDFKMAYHYASRRLSLGSRDG